MPQLLRLSWTASLVAAVTQVFLSATPASAMNLTLAQAYQGATFFDGFVYNASVIDNTTQGNIQYARTCSSIAQRADRAETRAILLRGGYFSYLDRTAATTSNLTYINAAGNAIIKVDNTTSGAGDPTFGRNSIKLVSNASYGLGTLYLIDAVHLPYGCSVWPAIWTLSSVFKTDDGGEIDIWEGINNVSSAQYTLHTKNGCMQSNNTALPYNGNVVSTNCYYGVNGNQGCATTDNRTSTYGAPFAQNGGGVFAMLQDGNGIQTWFWPRTSIPEDVTSGSPDPDTWGVPVASWPSTTCDMEEYFTEQNIIINITLCGLWAGNAEVYAQTCSGLCTDLIADPANYNNAYFELASIKTYTGAPTTPSITNATQVESTTGIAGAASTPKGAALGQGTSNSLLAGLTGAVVAATLF